jgi:hypothetical protein
VHTEQCLDAARLLQVQRRHGEVCLELLEPPLDRRLLLVARQKLPLRQPPLVRDQRRDPVALHRHVRPFQVDPTPQVETLALLLDIPHLGPRAAATLLAVFLIGPLLDLHRDPSRDAAVPQDRRDGLGELGSGTVPRPR